MDASSRASALSRFWQAVAFRSCYGHSHQDVTGRLVNPGRVSGAVQVPDGDFSVCYRESGVPDDFGKSDLIPSQMFALLEMSSTQFCSQSLQPSLGEIVCGVVVGCLQ